MRAHFSLPIVSLLAVLSNRPIYLPSLYPLYLLSLFLLIGENHKFFLPPLSACTRAEIPGKQKPARIYYEPALQGFTEDGRMRRLSPGKSFETSDQVMPFSAA
jgi:hypothetical protein